MDIFDLKDELSHPRRRNAMLKIRINPVPFKQSMVTVMGLTEEQKEEFLAAKKKFVSQCKVIRAERENSASHIKQVIALRDSLHLIVRASENERACK